MATSLLLAGGAAYMANKWITARAVPVSPVAMTNILTAAMNLLGIDFSRLSGAVGHA